MPTKTLMTVGEFDALPPNEGIRYELLEGELFMLASPMYYHQEICTRLIGKLIEYCRVHGGAVNHNTDFKLANGSVLAPDVFYVSAENLARINKHERNEGAPDLSIEVWSPSNTGDAEDLRRKAQVYLASGARAVWLIYPEPRHGLFYKPGRPVEVRDDSQSLDDPEVLPGFSVKLADILE
ncbi:MAG: Uma2 family endonuclease [Terriglobia bacterium]